MAPPRSPYALSVPDCSSASRESRAHDASTIGFSPGRRYGTEPAEALMTGWLGSVVLQPMADCHTEGATYGGA